MSDLSQEWIDRLRALVACPQWRWMGGCRYMWPGTSSWNRYGADSISMPDDDAIPDPRDPATLGCLLSMLPEPWELRWEPLYPGTWEITWGHAGCVVTEPLWERWQAVVMALCEVCGCSPKNAKANDEDEDD